MGVSLDLPADDDAVVKQVDLDVLDPDGLVEALWDQQAQQPPQVWGVVQGHAHLRGEALQQWQQHGSGVDRPWNTQRSHTHTHKRSWGGGVTTS